MKKLLLALLLASLPVMAQRGGQSVTTRSAWPICSSGEEAKIAVLSGSCPTENYFCLSSSNSTYKCKDRVWTKVASTTGGGVTEQQLANTDLAGVLRVVNVTPSGACTLASPPVVRGYHSGATWEFYTCQSSVWTLAGVSAVIGADSVGTAELDNSGGTTPLAGECVVVQSGDTAKFDYITCPGGGAPTDATYIVQTADGTLTNEQALASLATGLMKVTTTTGVVSSITDLAGLNTALGSSLADGDHFVPESDPDIDHTFTDEIGLVDMEPGTAGNLITYDASGNPAAVATGTVGQVLTSGGAGVAPTFADGAGATTEAGLESDLTDVDDVLTNNDVLDGLFGGVAGVVTDVDTLSELNAALGTSIEDGAHDGNASTICVTADSVLDAEGDCVAIPAGGTDDQVASEVPFTPDTAGEWTAPPDEVDKALEDLAPRVLANDTKVSRATNLNQIATRNHSDLTHAADDHREHATLEESAEIDGDITTHAAITTAHHTATPDQVGTVNDGEFCQGGAGSVLDCDVSELADADVSNTLQSSLFVGSGSTTNAIDLATAEAAGTLPLAKGGTDNTTIADNQILVGNDGATAFAKATIQDCADGTESLDWNETTDTFECNTITGGSASNSFETWDPPLGSNPVADGSTDTIQITASAGLDITGTEAANDVIDFSLDFTELNTLVFGSGTFTTLSFNAGTADPTFTFGDDSVAVTNAATFTIEGSQVVTTGDTETVTSTMVTDDTLTFADFSDSSAIDANTTLTAASGVNLQITSTNATGGEGAFVVRAVQSGDGGTLATLDNLDGIRIEIDPEGTEASDTIEGLVIEMEASATDENVDAGIRITQYDDAGVLADAIKIGAVTDNTITNALNVSDPEIAIGIALGDNPISVSAELVTADELEELSTLGGNDITAANWTALANLSGENTGDVTPNAGTDITADLEEEGEINTTAVTGNAGAVDQMILGTAANTASWIDMPSGGTDGCSAAGDKPIYTASSNSWSCGTDGGGSADGLGTDGDKGDITVGGTGTTLEIDAGAVFDGSGVTNVIAASGDDATNFFSIGLIDQARLDEDVVLDNDANTWGTALQSFALSDLELPNSTSAPLGTDCDAPGEEGRVYVDWDAADGDQVFICVDAGATGTPAWLDIDSGGGSSAWSALTAPTGATSFVSDVATETVTFDFTSAFTSANNQFVIKQTTSAPTAGAVLLELSATNSNVDLLEVNAGGVKVAGIDYTGDVYAQSFTSEPSATPSYAWYVNGSEIDGGSDTPECRIDVTCATQDHCSADMLCDLSASDTEATVWKINSQGAGDTTFDLDTTLRIKESDAGLNDTAGYGQVWVKNTDPAELWYTDDAGTPFQLGQSGTGAFADGTPVTLNTDTKDVHIGPSTGAVGIVGKVEIAGDTDEAQLVIEANGTQTSDILVIQEDAGTNALVTVDGTGLIETAVGISAIGNVDMEYGHSGVTNHTFQTDGTGDPEIVLPFDSIGLSEMTAATPNTVLGYNASGDPALIANGTPGHVLTANSGAPPTFQVNSPGGSVFAHTDFDSESNAQNKSVIWDGGKYIPAWITASNIGGGGPFSWTGTHTFDGLIDIGTVETFTATDTTPDVSTGVYWITHTTDAAITDFVGTPIDGQLLVVEESDGGTTLDCTASGLLCGTADIVMAAADVATFIWTGVDWTLLSYVDQGDDLGTDEGSGGGEANTYSSDGGGLAVIGTKAGVDLPHATFAAADFDLVTDLITIDDTKWAKDTELHTPSSDPDTDHTMANNVDGSHIELGSDAQGDIMYYSGTDYVRLAAGTDGQYLETNGVAAPTWTSVAKIATGPNPTVIAAGDIGWDTTALPATEGEGNLKIHDGGTSALVIPTVQHECATIENLAGADDDFPVWTPPYAVTLKAAYCTCIGTCTTEADITFDIDDGTPAAVTGTVLCETPTTGPLMQALSGAVTVNPLDTLRFDTSDTTDPETDKYTICWTYTVDP